MPGTNMKTAAAVVASMAVAWCSCTPSATVSIPEEVRRDEALTIFEGWQAAFEAFELGRLESGQMGSGQTQCPDGGHFAWSYLFDDANITKHTQHLSLIHI